MPAGGAPAPLQLHSTFAVFAGPVLMSQPETVITASAAAAARMIRMPALFAARAAMSLRPDYGAERRNPDGDFKDWLTLLRKTRGGFHPHQVGLAAREAGDLAGQQADLVIGAHQLALDVAQAEVARRRAPFLDIRGAADRDRLARDGGGELVGAQHRRQRRIVRIEQHVIDRQRPQLRPG